MLEAADKEGTVVDFVLLAAAAFRFRFRILLRSSFTFDPTEEIKFKGLLGSKGIRKSCRWFLCLCLRRGLLPFFGHLLPGFLIPLLGLSGGGLDGGNGGGEKASLFLYLSKWLLLGPGFGT